MSESPAKRCCVDCGGLVGADKVPARLSTTADAPPPDKATPDAIVASREAMEFAKRAQEAASQNYKQTVEQYVCTLMARPVPVVMCPVLRCNKSSPRSWDTIMHSGSLTACVVATYAPLIKMLSEHPHISDSDFTRDRAIRILDDLAALFPENTSACFLCRSILHAWSSYDVDYYPVGTFLKASYAKWQVKASEAEAAYVITEDGMRPVRETPLKVNSDDDDEEDEEEEVNSDDDDEEEEKD